MSSGWQSIQSQINPTHVNIYMYTHTCVDPTKPKLISGYDRPTKPMQMQVHTYDIRTCVTVAFIEIVAVLSAITSAVACSGGKQAFGMHRTDCRIVCRVYVSGGIFAFNFETLR